MCRLAALGGQKVFDGSEESETYIMSQNLTWQWRIHHEWRCISNRKWEFSNVMLVFREDNFRHEIPILSWERGDNPSQGPIESFLAILWIFSSLKRRSRHNSGQTKMTWHEFLTCPWNYTRWAPSSYKWRYNPYNKWGYNLSYQFIRPFIRVITPGPSITSIRAKLVVLDLLFGVMCFQILPGRITIFFTSF